MCIYTFTDLEVNCRARARRETDDWPLRETPSVVCTALPRFCACVYSALMKPWPRWRAYVLAVAVTAAVLLMRVLAEPWMGHRPFLLVFLLPVILAAYMGGLRPGLFATALSGLSTKLFVFPPFNRAWFGDNLDFAHWLFLLLVGLLISMLFDELQQWRDKTGVRSSKRRHAATERKVRVGFAIAMAFLGAIGIVSFLSVVRLSENARLVAHSQLVMSNIDALVATTFENESAQRAYVLTGEEQFAAEYTR